MDVNVMYIDVPAGSFGQTRSMVPVCQLIIGSMSSYLLHLSCSKNLITSQTAQQSKTAT